MVPEVDLLHLLIGYLCALGVVLSVKAGTDAQPSLGARRAYEIEDRVVVSQGLRRPVLANEREHAVFNRVPLR